MMREEALNPGNPDGMGNIVYHRRRTGCITDLIGRMHCMGVGVYGQGIASQSSQNGDCSNGMMYEVSCHII